MAIVQGESSCRSRCLRCLRMPCFGRLFRVSGRSRLRIVLRGLSDVADHMLVALDDGDLLERILVRDSCSIRLVLPELSLVRSFGRLLDDGSRRDVHHVLVIRSLGGLVLDRLQDIHLQ